jgi:hypothetical protein
MPDDLERLAGLIQIKNEADAAIADLIGRPAAPGNIGEFVAASVFAIRLMPSAAHPGYDGVFSEGPLAGKTVNIKTCSRHESVLDISPHPSDCYLVLTGPAGQARVLPWSSTRCSCSTASNCWPRSQPAVSRSASLPACGNRSGKPHGPTRRSRRPRCCCPAPRSPALNSSRPHTPLRTTETSTAPPVASWAGSSRRGCSMRGRVLSLYALIRLSNRSCWPGDYWGGSAHTTPGMVQAPSGRCCVVPGHDLIGGCRISGIRRRQHRAGSA